MMRLKLSSHVASLLDAHLNDLQESARDSWTFSPIAGHPLRGYARTGEEWLSLYVPLLGSSKGGLVTGDEAMCFLLRNGSLSGGARFALAVSGSERRVQAEIPLPGISSEETKWFSAQLQAAIQGLGDALAEPDPGKNRETVPSGVVDAANLQTRCTEAGWVSVASGPDEVRIELRTTDAYRVARATSTAHRLRMRIKLDIGAMKGRVGNSNRPVALFLLRAGAAQRMARPWVARQKDGDLAMGFEVGLVEPSPRKALNDALSALTVSCELFAREAEAFAQSKTLARHYLKICEKARGRVKGTNGRCATAIP